MYVLKSRTPPVVSTTIASSAFRFAFAALPVGFAAVLSISFAFATFPLRPVALLISIVAQPFRLITSERRFDGLKLPHEHQT